MLAGVEREHELEIGLELFPVAAWKAAEC